ncbi:MAG TPA: transposase, partial [Pirellulales bacterium]|nr:transposase [Pirellulales bacterium]
KTKGTLFGRTFWSRGYCVSTVGLDEAMIREYIQNQEKDERDQERGLFGLE